MPYRIVPIVRGEIYHIYNRSIAKLPIFLHSKDYQRGLELIDYYQLNKPPIRFSHYKRMAEDQRRNFILNLKKISEKRIEILAYCLMPNHVHFLFRQLTELGISDFMSNFQESYAKYFNFKEERSGALFQSMFKAVRIEDDDQLLHVVRYIHLNPVTAFIIKDFSNLENYSWCSYQEYINTYQHLVTNVKEILEYFTSVDEFIKFTSDQVEYQRQLDQIKHLILE